MNFFRKLCTIFNWFSTSTLFVKILFQHLIFCILWFPFLAWPATEWFEYLEHNKLNTIIFDPEGDNDGFGHRLQRLYASVSTMHNLHLPDFTFPGYDYIISQDAVYMPSIHPDKKIYCHSIQDYETTKPFFDNLRTEIPQERLYDPFLTIELLRKKAKSGDGAVISWLQSLKCEYVDFDKIHDIKKSEQPWSEDPKCILDLEKPPNPVVLESCKSLRFVVGNVQAEYLTLASDSSATSSFDFSQVGNVSVCEFSNDVLDIALHFRIGDRISQGGWDIKQRAFQQVLDFVILTFSHLSNIKIQIHIFTELFPSCPPDDSDHFPSITSIKLESKCVCQHQQFCILNELVEGIPCTPVCPTSLKAAHRMELYAREKENIVKLFGGSVKGERVDVPVILHASGNSVANDFKCLISSDVLITSCSSLSALASSFTHGAWIEQKCREGTQRGYLLLEEGFFQSKLWLSVLQNLKTEF